MAHSHESLFGPSSEAIDLSKLLQESAAFQCQSETEKVEQKWDRLEPTVKASITLECDVSDLRRSLDDTWKTPRLAAHIMKTHDNIVAGIHDAADRSTKRKRRRGVMSESAHERPEVINLQTALDGVRLKCWPLESNSALFIRTSKNSDQNALSEVKPMSNRSLTRDAKNLLLTITVYNPISWNHSSLSRSSQHVILASQTLGDLYEIIPCPSKEMPEAILEDDHLVGYDDKKIQNNHSCVLCIDGVAYGDGKSESDYADKLLSLVEKRTIESRPQLTKSPTSMNDTTWASLSIKINQPYWLLHQGDCTHYVVIEQIRWQHSSDPVSGYPLTTHLTPPLLPLCRACSKVTAAVSVVGDVRLGESPCVLCNFCWQSMGVPKGDDEVIVIPLSRHELGWRP